MADTLPQPATVFSRDLKYMLDSRHAAAPSPRSTSRIVLTAGLLLVLTIATWTGARMLTDGDEQSYALAGQSTRSAFDGSYAAPRQPEYTQIERAVSKSAGTIHPPIDIHDDGKAAPLPEPDLEWQTYTVRRGDTLGKIFQRFSINIGLASRIAEHETGRALIKLLPDRKIRLGFDVKGKLVKVRYELSRLGELVVTLRPDNEISASERKIPVETRERSAGGTIGSSLFVAGSKAGLSDRLILQLVSIFGWEIDFALDIRSGDRFSVIYEELIKNGEPIGMGDIVAAEFVNQGKTYRAIRHIDDQGRKEYFDLAGNSLRGTFLRTPMRVSRVTSGFSKKRFHPVLKEWRAHRGVDYGAPRGTPVLATGDGRVHSAGRNGGYGNTVVLKHGGQYSTLYAHLSRFAKGIRRGAEVHQGDVVGYVGATGLATGPHLHYEFRVNGSHRDPLSFEAPKAEPIEERYRDEFLALARDLMDEIEAVQSDQVASR